MITLDNRLNHVYRRWRSVNTLFHPGVEIQPNIPETPAMVCHLRKTRIWIPNIHLLKLSLWERKSNGHGCSNPGGHLQPSSSYGGVGLGKLHFMQAIGNKYERAIKRRVSNVTIEVYEWVIAPIGSKTPQKFRNRYRNVDILLVDDDLSILRKKKQLKSLTSLDYALSMTKQISVQQWPISQRVKNCKERLVSFRIRFIRRYFSAGASMRSYKQNTITWI